jgi:RimK family alpha-L-glutamate ligase
MRFAVIARRATATNVCLAAAPWGGVGGSLLPPREASRLLDAGDVALARLDVRRTLDGVERGLDVLPELEERGVLVLNSSQALLGAHDKLLTARLLEGAGVPHPATHHISGDELPRLDPPLVLKPRFGSWGRDVVLCSDSASVRNELARLRRKTWFRKGGALAQALVPLKQRDMRVLVAGGRVVGGIQRLAARHEWRTNVALGGTRHPVVPPKEARRVALAAAEAVGGDLVGIDLLPGTGGGFVALEVNGAVEFNAEYSLGRNVFAAVQAALARPILSLRSKSIELARAAAGG